MSPDEIRTIFHTFLRERIGPEYDPAAVAPAVSLFEGGWLDSLGMVDLLQCIESRFGVKVSEREAPGVARASLEGLVQFVQTRRVEPRS